MPELTEKKIVARLKKLGYIRADGKKIDDTNWLKPDLELLLKSAEHLDGLDFVAPSDMKPAKIRVELKDREVKFKEKTADSSLIRLLMAARLDFVVAQFKEGNEPKPPEENLKTPKTTPSTDTSSPEDDDPIAVVEETKVEVAVKDPGNEPFTAEMIKEAVMEAARGMFTPAVLMDIKIKLERQETVPFNATLRISSTSILRLHSTIYPPRR